VALLEEDSTQNNAGHDLWTTGTNTLAATPPTAIETRVWDWMQRIRITNTFAGGTLVRELRLYRGVPRIDCSLELDNVSLDGKILAALFDAPAQGRAPVYGERYGAVVGRRSVRNLVFQTKGIENPSGTAARPAHFWAAISPNDHIQVGPDGALPLAPATIIHGNDPLLEEAAREVLRAWARRGIPASISTDSPDKPDFLWSDSTESDDFNAALDHDTAMRIVIGNPNQNEFTKKLVEGLPEETASALSEQSRQGTIVYLEDEQVPAGHAPVPTVILLGNTLGRIAELAQDFADSIRNRGVFAIPPSAYYPASNNTTGIPRRPDSGLAVFFPGTRLSSVERDGTLVMGLAHGVTYSGTHGGTGQELTDSRSHKFEYAIHPFKGTWREAQIPAAARGYAGRLIGVVDTLHTGRLPKSQSFLRTSTPGLIVTAIKPAGYAMAAMSAKPVQPRDNLVIRAFESVGRPWSGSFEFFIPLRAVDQADFMENTEASVPFQGSVITHTVESFSINTLTLVPSDRFVHGLNTHVGRSEYPYGPIPTAYWLQNTGAAPLKNQPVSITLQGALSGEEATIKATVANNLTDQDIEGMVRLSASNGWGLGPNEFHYLLAPGEHISENIVVARPAETTPTGGIVATTTYGNQIYRATLDTMDNPLSLDITRNEAQIKIVIQNRSGIPAEGFLDLVVPPKYWPELGMNPPITVMPRRAAVYVPPFKTQTVLFRLSGPGAPLEAVAKLAANGHLLYGPVP